MTPKSARFVFAVGIALTAVMTWAVAASSSLYPIYQPQLLLLF
jgi:hypothetical protein